MNESDTPETDKILEEFGSAHDLRRYLKDFERERNMLRREVFRLRAGLKQIASQDYRGHRDTSYFIAKRILGEDLPPMKE